MFRDLVLEAVTAISARPSRSILTTVGTVVGVGALVTVLGFATTIRGQVSDRFDAVAATTVVVADQRVDSATAFPFTPVAEENVRRLNGVVGAGSLWAVQASGSADVAVKLHPGATGANSLVFAASPGLWDVVRPAFLFGRGFDDFHADVRASVVVIGSSLAATLGIESLVGEPAILINDRPYVIIGILSDVERRSDLLLSVIIPAPSAIERWGYPGPEASGSVMLIATRPGAAQQIAREAPLAIAPAGSSVVRAEPPPDPRSLRESVDEDLTALLLSLSVVCLVIGGVGIGNTTLVAVLERVPEFGLRRALGAERRHVAAQVVLESGLLGLLGGLIGTSLGVLAVLAVALAQEWTPILSPGLALVAPALGLVVGILAGAYPAWRAGTIEPIEALRR